MIYALDSNIIIKYVRGETAVIKNVHSAIVQGKSLVVPAVVDYEVSRGFLITPSPNMQKTYDELLEKCDIIVEIDGNTWHYAAQIYANLRKNGFTVGEMDILIAALCMVNGFTLVTNNTSDFGKIDGLKLVDWT